MARILGVFKIGALSLAYAMLYPGYGTIQRGDKIIPAYVFADIMVTDDSWIPEYVAKVPDIVHKHGGQYLSRTGNI